MDAIECDDIGELCLDTFSGSALTTSSTNVAPSSAEPNVNTVLRVDSAEIEDTIL